VDLPKVFEEFVTTTLGAALEDIGGSCTKQDSFTLDDGLSIAIKPDLVWRVHNHPAAVVDAKYKAEKPSGFPQADLYQAHAYATAYGLDQVHLVYADGNEMATAWVVRNSGVLITAHTLQLHETPEAILGQITQLATTISSDVSASMGSI
jgi:5-methylcytosine-specific restriction enzyme subunit McrC